MPSFVIGACVFTTILCSAPVSAQIAVELRGGVPVAGDRAIRDGEAQCCYGHGWVKEPSGASSVEGRLSVAAPWGLRPFVGYHQRSFRDDAPMALLADIYGAGMLEGATPDVIDVRHRVRGFSLGATLEPGTALLGLRPFVLGEATRDRFSSRTELAMDLPPRPDRGGRRLTGSSHLRTESAWGWGAGAGVRVSIGAFELRPLVHYATVEAPTSTRTFEWARVEGDGSTHEMRGDLDIPEGQELRTRYLEFSLGVSRTFRVPGVRGAPARQH